MCEYLHLQATKETSIWQPRDELLGHLVSSAQGLPRYTVRWPRFGSYGGWFRNPSNHLRLVLVVYPNIYRVLYIPDGCLGFLPSLVWLTWWNRWKRKPWLTNLSLMPWKVHIWCGFQRNVYWKISKMNKQKGLVWNQESSSPFFEAIQQFGDVSSTVFEWSFETFPEWTHGNLWVSGGPTKSTQKSGCCKVCAQEPRVVLPDDNFRSVSQHVSVPWNVSLWLTIPTLEPWCRWRAMCVNLLYNACIIWAPAKTSHILEKLHQEIDTWYYHLLVHDTLRNDRGDTESDDFWYTCLTDFIAHIKSSGTLRDTQKAMTMSATSFHGCSRFSPLLIYSYTHICDE